MIHIDLSKEMIYFLGFFVFTGIAKLLVTKVFYKKYLAFRGIEVKTDLEKSKFGLSLYRLIYYISAVIVGFLTLRGESFIFNMKELGTPLKTVPYKFMVYLTYELGFYVVELITIFFEPGKKDLLQMILHHIVTLTLMALSFNTKTIKFGVLILILHDCSDPLLEACKIENRFKNQIAADIIFVTFMIVFFCLRLVVYPKFIIATIFKTLYVKGISYSEYIILLFLLALQVMHIIWFKFIVMVVVRMFKGKGLRDSREVAHKVSADKSKKD